MIAETIPQIRAMGTQEKFQLAAELWQDVLQHEDEVQDPPGIAAMLEDRLARYRSGEVTGRSWEEVRASIQRRD